MNNIKVFENDLPDIDLSNEKTVSLDCEALGLVLGRDPLTLVQIGLESKQFFLIKLNRKTYDAPNLVKLLSDDKITKIKLTEAIAHTDNATGGKRVKDSRVVSLMRYYELIKELDNVHKNK